MLTVLNLSLGPWGAKAIIKAEADMTGFVLSGKDAGSSAEYDLGQTALLTGTGCQGEPLCVHFLVLRNPTFSASDVHLG